MREAKLTHSATSPNAWRWGVRAVSPKGLEKKEGLSLSVSTLSIPIVNREINLENKPQCLPLGYTNVLTFIGLISAFAIVLSLSGLRMALAEEKELPPGISKQGRIPGKGLHKGWEQGKHKGWDKKKSEDAKELKRRKKEELKNEVRQKKERRRKIKEMTEEMKKERKDIREESHKIKPDSARQERMRQMPHQGRPRHK